MNEHIKSEIVFEFEENKTDSNLDEAFIDLENDKWLLSVGRQLLPFGVFYSNFITGPLLEFGEKREFVELDANANRPQAWNAELAYYPPDTWELAVRFERSEELSDESERRYGIATNG